MSLKAAFSRFQIPLRKLSSFLHPNLFLSKVRYPRKHGAVKEIIKSVSKDMVSNGFVVTLLVITTRAIHLMAKWMGKAPINGAMEAYMKEVGLMINKMAKV